MQDGIAKVRCTWIAILLVLSIKKETISVSYPFTVLRNKEQNVSLRHIENL